MAPIRVGDRIPGFRFDTPYQPQLHIQGFYADKPLFMVFLDTLDDPVTRRVLAAYTATIRHLMGCELACVVRTTPPQAAAVLQKGILPFVMICDERGLLTEHFSVQRSDNWRRCGSVRGAALWKRAGKKRRKGQSYHLPLTVLADRTGKVVMARYGRTVTDLPEDCGALSSLCRKVFDAKEKAEAAAITAALAQKAASLEKR